MRLLFGTTRRNTTSSGASSNSRTDAGAERRVDENGTGLVDTDISPRRNGDRRNFDGGRIVVGTDEPRTGRPGRRGRLVSRPCPIPIVPFKGASCELLP